MYTAGKHHALRRLNSKAANPANPMEAVAGSGTTFSPVAPKPTRYSVFPALSLPKENSMV